MRDGPAQAYLQPERIPDRNTLKVYWFILLQPKGFVGVRQVQRAMGFSSPNAAIFHLNKLVDMQLIRGSRNGEYHIRKRKKFGPMKAYLILRKLIIPKHAIYAIALTSIMVACILFLLPVLSLPTVIALIPGLLSMVILWFEAIIVWRQRPKFE